MMYKRFEISTVYEGSKKTYNIYKDGILVKNTKYNRDAKNLIDSGSLGVCTKTVCLYCKHLLPVENFSKNSTRCKKCRKETLNVEKTRAYQKKHYTSVKKPLKETPLYRASGIAATVKCRALKNGLDYELSPEIISDWMVLNGFRCVQTGILFDLSVGRGRNNRTLRSPSVDRINPDNGYTLENSQLVCLFYNIGKNNQPEDEFWDLMCQAVDFKRGVKNG